MSARKKDRFDKHKHFEKKLSIQYGHYKNVLFSAKLLPIKISEYTFKVKKMFYSN